MTRSPRSTPIARLDHDPAAVAPLRRLAALLLVIALGCGGAAGGGAAHGGDALESTPRGTPMGPAVTKVIGSSGGTLVSADGDLTLTVPPGAMTADTEFGIQPITNTAGVGVGQAYRLTPEGRTFAKPLQLAFRYAAGDEPSGLGIAFQDAKGVWWVDLRSEADEVGGTVSSPIKHFSDWAKVTYWIPPPRSARRKVGETLDLKVLACIAEKYVGPPPSDDDLLAPLVPRPQCEPSVRLGKWLVNGVEGGNATFGTVVAGMVTSIATYTAPPRVPTPNPVLVAAELTWVEKGLTKKFPPTEVTVTSDWEVTGNFSTSVKFNACNNTCSYQVSGAIRVSLQWDDAKGAYVGTGALDLDAEMGFFNPPYSCDVKNSLKQLPFFLSGIGNTEKGTLLFTGGISPGKTQCQYCFQAMDGPLTLACNIGLPLVELPAEDGASGDFTAAGDIWAMSPPAPADLVTQWHLTVHDVK